MTFATTPPPRPTSASPGNSGAARPRGWRRLAALSEDFPVQLTPAAGVCALFGVIGILALPESFSFAATATLAVFLIAVWMWSFTSIGDTYIALGAAVAVVLIGVIDVEVVFAALGEDTTWLLVGAFIISSAVSSSGLGVRAAVYLVAGCRSPRALVHMLTLAVVTTAFAIPATSGRAALVLPVFLALAGALLPQRAWLVTVLSLLLPTVILLSAVGSYIGAGAHLITDQILVRSGYDSIGYTGWLLLGMPLALVSSHLAAEVVLLLGSSRAQRHARLDLSLETLAAATPQREVITGPFTIHESRSVIVLVAVIVLWSTSSLHGVHPALIALLGALVITLPTWGPVRFAAALKTVPWSLLLFMAATLALGSALVSSGAAAGLTALVTGLIPTGGSAAPLFLIGVIIASAAAHLIIQSRSARSTVLVPIVIALAPAAGADPVIAALASTAAAGFCHTLNSSAKPLALFASVSDTVTDAEGTTHQLPLFEDAYRFRCAAVLAPVTCLLIALFALVIWPAMGVGLPA